MMKIICFRVFHIKIERTKENNNETSNGDKNLEFYLYFVIGQHKIYLYKYMRIASHNITEAFGCATIHTVAHCKNTTLFFTIQNICTERLVLGIYV